MNANIYKTYKINAFIKKHLNSNIYKKKLDHDQVGFILGMKS